MWSYEMDEHNPIPTQATSIPPLPMSDEVKQRHDYARNLFQITMSWYTWFVALNYGAFAWFATHPVKHDEVLHQRSLLVVSGLFLSHNGLGILWLMMMRKFIKDMARNTNTQGPLPHSVLLRGSGIMIVTVLSLSLVWIFVPFVF
jgi:hypothetical protein